MSNTNTYNQSIVKMSKQFTFKVKGVDSTSEITVDLETLTREPTDLDIHLPTFDVSEATVKLVEHFSCSEAYVIDESVGSYEMYVAMLIADAMAVRPSYVESLFQILVGSAGYLKFTHPEYLYFLHRRNSKYADYNHIFAEHPRPYESFVGAMHSTEVQNDPKLELEVIDFFKNFKIESVFETSDETTQTRLECIKKCRKECSDYFMVNITADKYSDMMKYVGDESYAPDTLWRNDDIAETTMPELDSSVVVSDNDVTERFNKYTFGVFETSPNPDIGDNEEFPWEGVMVAGGSMVQIINPNYKPRRSSDVDIFIYGDNYETNKKRYLAVRRWFDSPKTIFGVRGSVVYIYIEDIQRSFQLICGDTNNPFDVIGRFDLTGVQIGMYKAVPHTTFRSYELGSAHMAQLPERFDGMTVVATPECIETMRTRVSKIVNFSRFRTKRMLKHMINGFHVLIDEYVRDNLADIGKLVESRRPVISEVINEIHMFFYPMRVLTTDMSDEDRKKYYLGCIKLTTGCSAVDTNCNVIDNLVKIGGNFDVDYEAIGFERFTVDSVRFTNVRRRFKTKISNIMGPMRMLSSFMEIIQFNISEKFLTMTLQIPDDDEAGFEKFLSETLEQRAIRLYTPLAVTKKILNDKKQFDITMSTFAIESQLKRGSSPLRSQRGEVLDVYDSFKSGARVQILFSVLVDIDVEGDRTMKIIPHKFILFDNNEAAIPDAAKIEATVTTPKPAEKPVEFNQVDLDDI